MIGLCNAGGDTINSIKQAAEFGIVKGGQKLPSAAFSSDVAALGLPTAQGLALTWNPWYWDANDTNRALDRSVGTRRVQQRVSTRR